MNKQKRSGILLSSIMVFFSLLYIATSKESVCDSECEAIGRFSDTATRRWSHVQYVLRCGRTYDTICMNVTRVPGVNWNLFADTVCMLANQSGMSNTRFYLVDLNAPPRPDTIITRLCP